MNGGNGHLGEGGDLGERGGELPAGEWPLFRMFLMLGFRVKA